MAHGIQTLGQIIAENSVAARNGGTIRPLPNEEDAKGMPMNRAEVRYLAKHFFPRDIRKQVFGVWRKRALGGV